ncbi:Txe/YoeB family addiction module toxin [Alcaligenaceae bacterium]|nr:Txe/YoeB family addiction module toxin [Alcaligenaceae bacterium]
MGCHPGNPVSGFKTKVQALIGILEVDPLQNPPPYEKLVGDLSGAYSRRINIHHRLVYKVFVQQRIVRILRMWTHYE